MANTPTTTVDLYYTPEMAVRNDPHGNFSKSPSKPRRFAEHLLKGPLSPHVRVERGFAPLTDAQLLTAHTPDYVEAFFAGEEPLASSNGLNWTAEFARSVRYTNGSLLAAVRGARAHPERIALSPTSGFHHARPDSGGGFCTFSGQAIAALDVYRSSGARGAWIDLDGHFGNSIEDTRSFAPDLDAAIPINLNPINKHGAYLASLEKGLQVVLRDLVLGRLEYVAFAHGADSHEWDDLGGQCTTEEWLFASEMVYEMVSKAQRQLGRPVPLVLALFGGYRDDDPDSVLELHCADLAVALREVAGLSVDYAPQVKPRAL